jgi:transcriptional regulator with XRE-family HTH domain
MKKMIAEIMDFNQWNQVQLAKELGVHAVSVNRWLNQGMVPTAATLHKIEDIYDIMQKIRDYMTQHPCRVTIEHPITKQRLSGVAAYCSDSRHPLFRITLEKEIIISLEPRVAFTTYDMRKIEDN